MKVPIKLPTHIEEHHVKHTASLTIIGGTLLEALHMLYPSGLILLSVGGLIAVYEPYILHTLHEVWLPSEED